VSDQGNTQQRDRGDAPQRRHAVDAVMDRELAGGEFKRQASRFRDWVGVGLGGEKGRFPVESGRYRLYVSLACPWCHRTAIVRELAGLAEAIPISYVAPFRDERGWAFDGERFGDGPGGRYVDELNGWSFMSEAYLASDPDFKARVTVPVLWDSHTRTIVNNESSDIIRMMGARESLGGLGQGAELELYPPPLRPEIDDVNTRVYDTINNGVYNAGFARRQTSYERAFKKLFESLGWLERLLGERRYLLGERVCEADWRLFPTLVRFDEVYHVHFRCNYRRIVEYPNLWGYTRELYQLPGVARTVAMEQIKRHYYTTHDELNPKHIIPLGPAPDWSEPHGRG
jgi:putative glutathione S-transferase